jgi:hypothetical protein
MAQRWWLLPALGGLLLQVVGGLLGPEEIDYPRALAGALCIYAGTAVCCLTAFLLARRRGRDAAWTLAGLLSLPGVALVALLLRPAR